MSKNDDALRCAKYHEQSIVGDKRTATQIRRLVAENEALNLSCAAFKAQTERYQQQYHEACDTAQRRLAELARADAKNEAQAALLLQAVEAATAAKQALDDWLTVYAEEFHSAEQVQQANDRIFNSGGTIGYVADTVKMQTDAIAAIRQHLEGRA